MEEALHSRIFGGKDAAGDGGWSAEQTTAGSKENSLFTST